MTALSTVTPVAGERNRLHEVLRAAEAGLNAGEGHALERIGAAAHLIVRPRDRVALTRLIEPLEIASTGWSRPYGEHVRNLVLAETARQQRACWGWDEAVWTDLAAGVPGETRARIGLVAFGHLLGGHHRLHHQVGIVHLSKVADAVFGAGAVEPALQAVRSTLLAWNASANTTQQQATKATVDLLLRCGSPRLEDITQDRLAEMVADTREAGLHSRRRGLFKLSRVLADQGIIAAPLTSNGHQRGPKPETLATVPDGWLEWVQRWRQFNTREQSTERTWFSLLLIAGRWVADKHPGAIAPDQWTRDMAAEYVADTLQATVGRWGGHNRNSVRDGQPLTVAAMANRIDTVRGFFCDLIEWEWIHPRFDPRRVITLPLSRRAQLGPNPRIIDDASWAKLMAAGLTLNTEDLKPYGTPRAHAAGQATSYYPIEMVRALVAVWLFGGCRVDEIRRLELDCIRWDQGTDEQTGQTYPICLLRVPANKTSGEFTKPVDPLVGQVIDAWKLIRSPQPDIWDRKTGQRRQHLFCHRGQLVGRAYLNDHILPALCRKAGIPETDSRGALTSHRARATIATQLLNARDPLTLADLQQWLGHKHPTSTRHYATILQRTLTAAYRKADYFARNVRTIEVLIDRETILSGAAANGQPWKYYDLGDGYCTYDFFATCPHRLACARCPFYLPKQSHAGQLLAVKDGIEGMLEQLDLTDDEHQALEGDRDAVTALAERLANTPTPLHPQVQPLSSSATTRPSSPSPPCATACTEVGHEGRPRVGTREDQIDQAQDLHPAHHSRSRT